MGKPSDELYTAFHVEKERFTSVVLLWAMATEAITQEHRINMVMVLLIMGFWLSRISKLIVDAEDGRGQR